MNHCFGLLFVFIFVPFFLCITINNKNFTAAVASDSKMKQPTGISQLSLKNVSTISGLKDLASSKLESIKCQLDSSHSEIMKDVEASQCRLQKRLKSASSSEPPRQTHHGGLFHNLQSQFSNFLQQPQKLFFNGCRVTAQTPNITPNQPWDALKQLFYPRHLVYNTRMDLRDLKRQGTIKDYVKVAAMIMLQIRILSDDDLLKLAYELQYWAKQELNFSNRDRKKNLAMSEEEIGERLCRVPVYNIKFSDYEAAQMASLIDQRKTILGYFLGKADAKAYAEHGLVGSVPSRIPYVDSEQLDIAMDYNMVYGPLKLIPEASEVKNALEVKKKAGLPCEQFHGIPVFESRNLSLCQGHLRITNEGCPIRRRSIFFKKEDLEKSLAKARVASHDGGSNFIDTETHIEVAALEDIIKAMKDNSTSAWNSVYFASPGQDFEHIACEGAGTVTRMWMENS